MDSSKLDALADELDVAEATVLPDGAWPDAEIAEIDDLALLEVAAGLADAGTVARVERCVGDPRSEPARRLALYRRAAAPTRQPAPHHAAPTSPGHRWRSAGWGVGVAAVAAGLLAAAWYLSRPPAHPPGGAPPDQREFAQTPRIEWGFNAVSPENKAGTIPGVVFDRWSFTVAPRVVTDRSFGWLFQIDSRGAYLLQKLAPAPGGALAASYSDKFDDNPGFEFYVVVLSDRPHEALDSAQMPAPWMPEAVLRRLQALGPAGDAAAEIAPALRLLGWAGVPADIMVLRVHHQPR